MITVRRGTDRGHADHGWLDSFHTFSFADYYDANENGWGSLRVINEDRVKPGQGFATHGHRDMEIISYVLSGELQHKDSMGNGTVIRPGDVQRMSAGTGVQHSEFNPSPTETVHFLQIWLHPEERGLEPSYEQKAFTTDDKRGRLCLVASRDGRSGSVTIHQDADVYASVLNRGERLTHNRVGPRLAYLHLVSGALNVNDVDLKTGDGVKVAGEPQLNIAAEADSEFLLFDLG